MPRLDQLHALLTRTPDDAELTYCIALEHKKAGAAAAALEWLDKTLALNAAFCYAYYQKGQVLESAHDYDAARQAYAAGVAVAKQAGDAKAHGELQGALDLLP